MESGRVSGLLHLGMLRRGVFGAGRLMYCISTPMGEPEVDLATAALTETLDELRSVIEEECPTLLA